MCDRAIVLTLEQLVLAGRVGVVGHPRWVGRARAALQPAQDRAVQGDAAVLVDGGIRRGTDVFKALALGADAVLVGRPCLYGLAHAGARGAAHVLRLLRDELEMAMTLCGCRTPQDITLAHLRWPSRS